MCYTHLHTSLKSVTISIATFISFAMSLSSSSTFFLSYCVGSRNSKNCSLNCFTEINEEHSPLLAILNCMRSYICFDWTSVVEQKIDQSKCLLLNFSMKHYGLFSCFPIITAVGKANAEGLEEDKFRELRSSQQR